MGDGDAGGGRHTSANPTVTRRIEEAVARVRVRILPEQARLTPYDAAPVHLVLSRTDGRLRVERGAVILRTAGLVTTAPIGVDTVRSVGCIRTRNADTEALAPLVPVGTQVYASRGPLPLEKPAGHGYSSRWNTPLASAPTPR